jgi:hypothetical protein
MIFNKLYYPTPERVEIEYTVDGGVVWQQSSHTPRPIYGNEYKSGVPNGYFIPSVDSSSDVFAIGNGELIESALHKFRFKKLYSLDLDNIYIKANSGMERYSKDTFNSYWKHDEIGDYHVYTYIRPFEGDPEILHPQVFNLEFHLI